MFLEDLLNPKKSQFDSDFHEAFKIHFIDT